METKLSSKGATRPTRQGGQTVRPRAGERLTIEVQGDKVGLRPARRSRRYRTARHPKSGLPVMVAVKPPRRKVSAAEVAALGADLA